MPRPAQTDTPLRTRTAAPARADTLTVTLAVTLGAAAALAGALAGPAAAQLDTVTRCTPVAAPQVDLNAETPPSVLPERADAPVTCRDDAGRTVPARRDSLGRLVIPDADGALVTGQTDSFGTTTFRTEPAPTIAPPSYTAAPDGVGGLVLRDDAGAVHRPMVDPLGNSMFRDSQNRVVHCHTDPVGVTFCN